MRSVRNAPKRTIHLSVNSKILDMAREMGLNISQTVDALLTEEVLRKYWQRWQTKKAGIAEEGLFSDRDRSFMQPAADQVAA